jgi:hypothetical protein
MEYLRENHEPLPMERTELLLRRSGKSILEDFQTLPLLDFASSSLYLYNETSPNL